MAECSVKVPECLCRLRNASWVRLRDVPWVFGVPVDGLGVGGVGWKGVVGLDRVAWGWLDSLREGSCPFVVMPMDFVRARWIVGHGFSVSLSGPVFGAVVKNKPRGWRSVRIRVREGDVVPWRVDGVRADRDLDVWLVLGLHPQTVYYWPELWDCRIRRDVGEGLGWLRTLLGVEAEMAWPKGAKAIEWMRGDVLGPDVWVRTWV